MFTFGALKSELRSTLWVTGEAPNLVAAHNKSIVDAIYDIQKWVECAKQNHTDVVPHCSTYYNCGLTVLDAPYGAIKKLSVIDRLDSDGNPDIEGTDDWCTEIVYTQVDACHIRDYLTNSRNAGCCLPFTCLALNFASCGGKTGSFPTPTGEGVPSNLPALPLGYHYPQSNTDATKRATAGVYAIEGSKIFIAPWIQSTESVIINWAGIKRHWTDSDPFPDDPLMKRAVRAWVAAHHKQDWDEDYTQGSRVYAGEYASALQDLIHECRERTRVRGCEPNHASGNAAIISELFYNEEQSYTATCPPPNQAESVTQTIPSGLVASTVSVEDANEKAFNQAKQQAESALSCVGLGAGFKNAKLVKTYDCAEFSDGNHPTPSTIGGGVTITIEAGEYTSIVSQAAADALAENAARAQAQQELVCTFYNKLQTATAACPPPDEATTFEGVAAEKEFASSISEADADALAQTAAISRAESMLENCPIPPVLYWNQFFEDRRDKVYIGDAVCPQTVRLYARIIINVPQKILLRSSRTAAQTAAAQLAAARHNELKESLGSFLPYDFVSLPTPSPKPGDPNQGGTSCQPTRNLDKWIQINGDWIYLHPIETLDLDEIPCPGGTTCEL